MGCTFTRNRHGYLALRLYWRGRETWEGAGLADTTQNRERVAKLAALIDAEVKAGKFTPERYLYFLPQGNRADQIRAELGIVAEAERAPSERFRDYAERWLAGQTKPARIASYHIKATSHLKRMRQIVLPGGRLFGDLRLDELNRDVMADLRRALLTQPLQRRRAGEEVRRTLSLKSAQNIMAGTLSAILAAAVAEGAMASNPVVRLKWKKGPRKRIVPLTNAERDAVIGWFAAKHPVYVPFVSTLLFTGMRIGEALALRWGDVDLERGVIDISKSRTHGEDNAPKTAASARTIEIIPELVATLKAAAPIVRGADDFVFRGREGGPVNAQNFYQRRWLGCLAKLKIAPRTLYQCRHTFLAIALSNGMNLKFAAQYCGTSVTIIERHYARWIVPTANQMDLIRGAKTVTPSLGSRQAASISAEIKGEKG